jgi:hypothetical protein
MRKWPVIIVLAAGMAATAATARREPVPSATQATALFEKGYERTGSGTGNNQFYSRAFDESCATLKGVARFAPLSGSSKVVALEAGRPHIFRAVTNYYAPAGTAYNGSGVTVMIGGSTCANQARFTPRAMTAYRIVQRASRGDQCYFDITEIATGAPPPDLVVEPFQPCVKPPK